MVQYLVLGHASRHRELTANSGNLALLKTAAGLGLIDGEQAEAVRAAYRQFRELQHRLRLAGERYARVEPQRVAASAAAVTGLWKTLLGTAAGAATGGR
jgi:glutamate-ammonia-ligase adenylyltransferase